MSETESTPQSDGNEQPEVVFDPERDTYFACIRWRAQQLLRSTAQAWREVDDLDSWAERRQFVTRQLAELLGRFPVRSPLHAQVTGRMSMGSTTVEKVVFSSRPQFHVTANVYLPAEVEGPAPAVLCPCGRLRAGKAAETYQRLFLSLAESGFVVMSFDAIGLGERVQYWNEQTGQPLAASGLEEQCLDANRLLALGRRLARYLVWDAVRALDYLVSRPDVDHRRVGCTGNSDGGAVAILLAAIDERVRALAPCCCVTSFRRLVARRVPVGPEWLLPDMAAVGLDLPDLLALAAPRPLLIGAATEDVYPIVGVREVAARVTNVYRLLGVADRTRLAECPGEHHWHAPLRQAVCDWMVRWLGDGAGPAEESTTPPAPAELLNCTQSGRAVDELGGDSLCSLAQRTLAHFRHTSPIQLTDALSIGDAELLRERLSERLRIKGEAFTPQIVELGEESYGDVVISSVAVQTESHAWARADLYHRRRSMMSLPTVLYLSYDEAELPADERDLLVGLAENQAVAVHLSPRGCGRLRCPGAAGEEGYLSLLGVESQLTYASLLSGVPPLGRRVVDVLQVNRALQEQVGISESVVVMGRGLGALTALCAGALCDAIGGVALWRSCAALRHIIGAEVYDWHVSHLPPGMLRDFDAPDVVASLAPRPCLVMEMMGPDRRPLDASDLSDEYARAAATYAARDAAPRLRLVPKLTDSVEDEMVAWLTGLIES